MQPMDKRLAGTGKCKAEHLVFRLWQGWGVGGRGRGSGYLPKLYIEISVCRVAPSPSPPPSKVK